jgi:hypothetical protein
MTYVISQTNPKKVSLVRLWPNFMGQTSVCLMTSHISDFSPIILTMTPPNATLVQLLLQN